MNKKWLIGILLVVGSQNYVFCSLHRGWVYSPTFERIKARLTGGEDPLEETKSEEELFGDTHEQIKQREQKTAFFELHKGKSNDRKQNMQASFQLMDAQTKGEVLRQIAQQQDSDTMGLLLENQDVDVNSQNAENKQTALHIAVKNNDSKTVQALLGHQNIDVDVQDENGGSSLHAAAEKGSADILDLLLPKSKKVNLQNIDGHAPLHYAANYGHANQVESLLDSGANILLRDKKGNTAMHLAVSEGRQSALEKLLPKLRHSDVDVQNNDGDTLLHIAVRNNNEGLAKLLVEHGADVTKKNLSGATPQGIAEKSKFNMPPLSKERESGLILAKKGEQEKEQEEKMLKEMNDDSFAGGIFKQFKPSKGVQQTPGEGKQDPVAKGDGKSKSSKQETGDTLKKQEGVKKKEAEGKALQGQKKNSDQLKVQQVANILEDASPQDIANFADQGQQIQDGAEEGSKESEKKMKQAERIAKELGIAGSAGVLIIAGIITTVVEVEEHEKKEHEEEEHEKHRHVAADDDDSATATSDDDSTTTITHSAADISSDQYPTAVAKQGPWKKPAPSSSPWKKPAPTVQEHKVDHEQIEHHAPSSTLLEHHTSEDILPVRYVPDVLPTHHVPPVDHSLAPPPPPPSIEHSVVPPVIQPPARHETPVVQQQPAPLQTAPVTTPKPVSRGGRGQKAVSKPPAKRAPSPSRGRRKGR